MVKTRLWFAAWHGNAERVTDSGDILRVSSGYGPKNRIAFGINGKCYRYVGDIPKSKVHHLDTFRDMLRMIKERWPK